MRGSVHESSKDEEQYRETLDYLLGGLAGKEAEEFEERYLADQEAFEVLEAIEEELIEDYLRGGLSPEKTLLFERLYLAKPENREKIDFAKRLMDCVSSERTQFDSAAAVVSPSPRTPSPRPGLAYSRGFAIAASLTVLFLIATSIWLSVNVARLNSRLAASEQARADLEKIERELRSRLESEHSNNNAVTEELQQVRDQLKALQQRESSVSILSLLLPPTTVRAAGQKHQARLTASVATLDLKLDVSKFDFQSYQATVRQLSGGVILSRENLKPISTPSGAVLDIKLSAASLKQGEYAVTLNGATATGESRYAGEYLFTVVRE